MDVPVFNTIVVVVSLTGLVWFLYRPAIQRSSAYQATVVPLANIMDVGFLMMTPIIVVLVGYDAPIFMLAICGVAIAAGFAISYNIRHYEAIEGAGHGDAEGGDRILSLGAVSQWALFAASVVNIGYYSQLMMILVLEPLGLNTEDRVTWTAVIVLLALAIVGYTRGLDELNTLGNRTTAFNLAAIVTVVIAFVAFNIEEAIAGRWDFPEYNPPNDPDRMRKLLGFFAMVQGFEASRYIGSRFDGELRITTMRWAQYIATACFTVLITASLLLFANEQPEPDATAFFKIAKQVSGVLPYLILVAAIGSQLSAIVNATSSRSDLLIEATRGTLQRRYTFLLLLVPAMVIVVFTNVTDAVSLASRVFAAYFLLQALIALILSARVRSWPRVAAFAAIGAIMGTIMIFGLSV